MAKEITKEDWSEFTGVVADAIKGHPQAGFITTIALRLGVYDEYQAWKTSPPAFHASPDEHTRVVLSSFRTIQTKPGGPVVDLDFLIQEFDKKLSSEMSANELRTIVLDWSANRKNEKGN